MTYPIESRESWVALVKMRETCLPHYLVTGWHVTHPDSNPIDAALIMQEIKQGKVFSARLDRWSGWLFMLTAVWMVLGTPAFVLFVRRHDPSWILAFVAAGILMVVGSLALRLWAGRHRKLLPPLPDLTAANELYESLTLLLVATGREEMGFGGVLPFPERDELISILHEKLVGQALTVRLAQRTEREEDSGHPSEEAWEASAELEGLYNAAWDLNLIRNPRDGDEFHDYYAEADAQMANA